MDSNSTTQTVLFPEIFSMPVVAGLDQEDSSSDGGALLLQAADERLGLSEALAECLRVPRQAGKVTHSPLELLRQRVFGIAFGYPDANDAQGLAEDPIHKLRLGRDPVEGEPLASRPTICRFENEVGRVDQGVRLTSPFLFDPKNLPGSVQGGQAIVDCGRGPSS